MSTIVRRLLGKDDTVVATDIGPVYVYGASTLGAIALVTPDGAFTLSETEAEHLARTIAPEITWAEGEPMPEAYQEAAQDIARYTLAEPCDAANALVGDTADDAWEVEDIPDLVAHLKALLQAVESAHAELIRMSDGDLS